MEYKFTLMLRTESGNIGTTHIIITSDNRHMHFIWRCALAKAWEVARNANAELVQITHWL